MSMNWSGKYDFKQFQEELAALERQSKKPSADTPAVVAPPAAPEPAAPKRRGRPPKVDPLAPARAEFEALRLRYTLSVADVVAWFPPEEGIAYLQTLIASAEPKPRKPRKKASPES
ncbi:hypothetical protein [Luteibacter sp. 9135]|uniref:hypothetical protein n=1 Tax=Luteibacter sp. 9135 TaxID=1500893 RepID=UPI0005638C6C|nr:hypothetical protein [Luteibacter sp. 9135]